MTPDGQLAVKRPADVPLDSLVRLMRSYEENLTRGATCTQEDILLGTRRPGHEENGWCLTGPGDEVLAWAVLTPRGDVLDAKLTALPGRYGKSSARTLLCLLLDRADELVVEHGKPYTITLSGVLHGDPVVPPVLEEAGFVPTGTTGLYDIDLSAAPLPLVLPDGGTLRQAGPHDLDVLHTLHLRCTARSPRTEDAAVFGARLRRLREAGGAALLLEVSGRPAGYVLARATEGEGRILDLAVDPAFRGVGGALALLTAGFAELRALGALRALASLETGDVHDPETLAPVFAVQDVRTLTRFRRDGDRADRPA